MDNQIFANELLVYAGTILVGVLIFAFIFLTFFSVVAVVAAARGLILLASPVTSLLKTAIATRQRAEGQAEQSVDKTGAPLLPPVVRESLGHGLSVVRTHAGSAAVGLASQAGKAAKASKTAVAAKWAAHRSADDESKAA